MRVLQRNSDLLQHPIDTSQHSIVPEPDDFVPPRGEVPGPPRVACSATSIELDHKVTLHATEVRDERPDRMLAAKLHAEPVSAEAQPERGLRVRELTAQLLGSIASLDDGSDRFALRASSLFISRLLKKGFSQPAPSLLSLPGGERVKEGSQFSCRVLRALHFSNSLSPTFSTPC